VQKGSDKCMADFFDETIVIPGWGFLQGSRFLSPSTRERGQRGRTGVEGGGGAIAEPGGDGEGAVGLPGGELLQKDPRWRAERGDRRCRRECRDRKGGNGIRGSGELGKGDIEPNNDDGFGLCGRMVVFWRERMSGEHLEVWGQQKNQGESLTFV